MTNDTLKTILLISAAVVAFSFVFYIILSPPASRLVALF
jgi:hypothetical protein